MMYESIHIKNFRGFEDLQLNDLGRVNLISGKNNVGKTSLLEAILLHLGAYNPGILIRANTIRGIESIRAEFGTAANLPLANVFFNFSTHSDIEIFALHKGHNSCLVIHQLRKPSELKSLSKQLEGKKNTNGYSLSIGSSHILEFKYIPDTDEGKRSRSHYLIFGAEEVRQEPLTPASPISGYFLSTYTRPSLEDVQYFSNIASDERLSIVVNTLKNIEPRLSQLSLLLEGGVTMIHGHLEGFKRPLVLPLMGEGISRLCSILLRLAIAKDGVVLIDEVENGLHHSVLEQVWQGIGQAAREFNTQVFATTHSYECIEAAHKAFSAQEPYDFRLHRLYRDPDDLIKAATYDEETMTAAIEANFEVR